MKNHTGPHENRGVRRKYQDRVHGSVALGNQLGLKAVLRKWQDSKVNKMFCITEVSHSWSVPAWGFR